MISIGLCHPGSSWISRAIDRETGGHGFSHAYLLFDEFDVVYEAHVDFGVKFSSRRSLLGDYLYPIHPQFNSRTVLLAAFNRDGSGYDVKGALHFEIGWIKQDPNKFQCAELVVECCQAAGMFPGVVAADVAPNDLFLLLQDQK